MTNKKSITDQQADALIKSWEQAGFVFNGNGFLDRDDPPECHGCGETGYFYALWLHPTEKYRQHFEDDPTVYYDHSASRSINRCYKCGWCWAMDDENEDIGNE